MVFGILQDGWERHPALSSYTLFFFFGSQNLFITNEKPFVALECYSVLFWKYS